MKTIKFLLSGILVCFAVLAQSQTMTPDVAAGLKTGNVNLINKYLAKSVDISILNTSKTCSSTEASAELSKFFQANAAKDFAAIHNGERTGSSYVIGKLTTSTGDFRVTYYAKKIETGDYRINQIKIEKF